MPFFKKKNNAISTVADNPLAQGATTLNVASGEGTKYPSTFPFRMTIWDANAFPNPGDDSGMEIVECTARTADALTIVRAKEGTADVEHSQGEKVAMLITAGIFDDTTYGIERIGQIIYDAIVAASGGDYTTIGAALTAGKKAIFVKAGSYNESKLAITNEGTIIVGERRGGVIINSTEDGGDDAARAVEIDANRVELRNLKVVGHDTEGVYDTYHLIKIKTASPHHEAIKISECDFEKTKVTMIDGDYNQIEVRNCIFDATDKLTAVDYLFSGFQRGSIIDGCKILSQEIDNTSMLIFGSMQVIVSGCEFTGNVLTINMDADWGGSLIGNAISCKKVTVNGNCFGNAFKLSSIAVDDYSLIISGGRWQGNYISTSYTGRPLLKITGAKTIFVGNRFGSGGTKILIDAANVVFCNNYWEYGPLTDDMDCELTSNANYCQCNENIFKGEIGDSGVPTITDNGAGNVKANNILYEV